jgi:lipoyl(octanoyl) transferase
VSRRQQILVVRHLGVRDYVGVWRAMQDFTDQRVAGTPDELWLLEHPAVFTLGQAGRAEHVLDPGDIPVIKVDRGGQVTFHGPGQLVAYLLLDLRAAGLGIKRLVHLLEQAVVALLAGYGIGSNPRPDAPGVYVEGAKIASLGLRVRRGCSFHGLALNVDMDLEPFSRINPCGYPGLAVTQIADRNGPVNLTRVGADLAAEIALLLGRRVVAAEAGDGQDGRPRVRVE